MSRLAKLPSPKVPRVPRLRKPSRPAWMRPDDGTDEIFEEMTLGEHLIELRTRIVRACMSIGVAFIAGCVIAYPLLVKIKDDANAAGGLDIGSPTDVLTI